MGDLKLTVSNAGAVNPVRSFEANSAPLETTTMGFNFSEANDFSKELQIGKDGPKVYVTPEQKFALNIALRNAEMHGLQEQNVSVVIDGKTHTTTASFLRNQL